MSWFWTLIFLSITCSNLTTEAKHHNKLPSAVIVGTVYCDTCSHQNSHKTYNNFIAGASVAVECKNNTTLPSFGDEAKTNKLGQFSIHLPFSISKNTKRIKGCTVELISSNEPLCSVAAKSRVTSSSLHLISRKGRKHIFSAGFLTFKPLKQPEFCDQKPSIIKLSNSEKLPPIANPMDKSFLPPIQDQKNPPNLGRYLQRLPELPKLPPLPQLPPLPPLPEIPFLTPVSALPRIPFLPPMPALPGIPFLPPMPALPGIPFLTPPHLTIPLPQFPFQPMPGSPRMPASKSKTSSP